MSAAPQPHVAADTGRSVAPVAAGTIRQQSRRPGQAGGDIGLPGGSAIPAVAGTAEAVRAHAALRRALRAAGPAPCQTPDVDPDDWFASATDREAARRARTACARCPVRVECAGYALAAREAFGVWGAVGSNQRQEALRDRRVAALAGAAGSRGQKP